MQLHGQEKGVSACGWERGPRPGAGCGAWAMERGDQVGLDWARAGSWGAAADPMAGGTPGLSEATAAPWALAGLVAGALGAG